MKEIAVLEATPEENTALEVYDYSSIIDAFLSDLDLKERTLDSYRKGLRYFFSWVKDQGIGQPRRSDIKAYKSFLIDRYRVSTVAAYLAAVRALFRWISQETGRPELNIADGIHAPKQTKEHKKIPLEENQAKHLLEVMPCNTLAEKRDRAIVVLMLYNGLRSVEIIRLNIKDLYTTSEGAFTNVFGKGHDSADKTLKVSPAAYDAIQLYLEARQAQDGQPKSTDPLFTSVSPRNYGQRMNPRTISRIGKESLQAAGYDDPRITCHSLRHTSATLALEHGATIDEVQALLRHENPRTTLIYAHNEQQRANKAVDALARALAG